MEPLKCNKLYWSCYRFQAPMQLAVFLSQICKTIPFFLAKTWNMPFGPTNLGIRVRTRKCWYFTLCGAEATFFHYSPSGTAHRTLFWRRTVTDIRYAPPLISLFSLLPLPSGAAHPHHRTDSKQSAPRCVINRLRECSNIYTSHCKELLRPTFATK